MKTIIRFFSMLALVGGIAVTGALAQNPCDDVDTPTAQYTKFTELWTPIDASLKAKKAPVEADVQTAINTGKGFLEKWGTCEAWAQQAKFVTANVKRFEGVLGELGTLKYFDRFDKAIAADNTAEIYAAGKDILAKQPDNINIQYVMALAANREIAKDANNKAYNADALRYAKSLLDQIKGGAKFNRKDKQGRETIGALKYEVTREDAISELTYTLGYINYYGQKDKKAAIPYFYQVTQTPGFRKDYAPVYAAIGEFYIDEAAPVGAQIADLIAKQKAAPTDDEKLKLDEEIKAKVALFNGYTERAMDAYARATKFAKTDTPAGQKYKDGLLATVKDLYKRRFDKEVGVDEWVSATVAKPLPDPTSAVQPVIDPEPAKTSTTGTSVGAATSTPAATTTTAGTGAAKTNAAAATTAKPVAVKTTKPRR